LDSSQNFSYKFVRNFPSNHIPPHRFALLFPTVAHPSRGINAVFLLGKYTLLTPHLGRAVVGTVGRQISFYGGISNENKYPREKAKGIGTAEAAGHL